MIYCIYEYEPLLDSCNMTIDDYARLATDIVVSTTPCKLHVNCLVISDMIISLVDFFCRIIMIYLMGL